MPIDDFQGNTFVAFTDISGFKELMNDENRTLQALDTFYSAGFRCLQKFPKFNGLFVSDCGIIFARDNQNKKETFSDLLKLIQKLSSAMIEINVMLTTSIAYGDFDYRQKIEFSGIEKNALHGGAYLTAYLANENELPKIEPGQCRIVSKNLPREIIDIISAEQQWEIEKQGDKFYTYYWMIKSKKDIQNFSNDYRDTYNRKYEGMISVLKRYNTQRKRMQL